MNNSDLKELRGRANMSMNAEGTVIKGDRLGQYIVVTPCKDEEETLPNLIQSMAVQTHKPILWVIVDDGSTDNTKEIIFDVEKRYNWIKSLFLNNEEGYNVGGHLAHVCNKGFEYAKAHCIDNDLEYDYIALIDADNIPERDYFMKLIERFRGDTNLGLISGNSSYVDVTKSRENIGDNEDLFTHYKQYIYKVQEGREDLPMGSARIWKRECFEDTGGGYAIAQAPDSISIIKAKLKGWDTKRYMDIEVVEREGQLKPGRWNGNFLVGETNYYRGLPIYIALLKSINYSFRRPYYIGIAYFSGYFKSWIFRKEKIDDDEILDYYRNTRPKELWVRIFKKPREHLKK
ncbi:MAG: glycosyltransferase [Halobacteriota archaeon]|nr:glycosyltransferase [Halobacteriota archaeon]